MRDFHEVTLPFTYCNQRFITSFHNFGGFSRYLLKSCEARVTWYLFYRSSGKTVVTYTQRSYSSLQKQEVHLTICLWAIHKRGRHQFLLTFSPLTPLTLPFFNMSYLTDSYIGFALKMESVSKNTIFGLKMMVKSGLKILF